MPINKGFEALFYCYFYYAFKVQFGIIGYWWEFISRSRKTPINLTTSPPITYTISDFI